MPIGLDWYSVLKFVIEVPLEHPIKIKNNSVIPNDENLDDILCFGL